MTAKTDRSSQLGYPVGPTGAHRLHVPAALGLLSVNPSAF